MVFVSRPPCPVSRKLFLLHHTKSDLSSVQSNGVLQSFSGFPPALTARLFSLFVLLDCFLGQEALCAFTHSLISLAFAPYIVLMCHTIHHPTLAASNIVDLGLQTKSSSEYTKRRLSRGFQNFYGIPGVEFFISLGFAEPTTHVTQAHFYIR